MRYTLNQIHAKIREFADAHLQVKGSYAIGELEEITNQEIEAFPFLYSIIDTANYNGLNVEVNIKFIVCDLVHKDLSNRIEVLSDTLQIVGDLRAYMDDSDFADYFVVSELVTCVPFADRFTDDVTGWSFDLRFNVVDLKDRCNLPI